MDQLQELLASLYPVKTNFELVRIGGNNDGGYLIPDDLEGITACFSPGVDVTASFEKDLLERGIKSHLTDASVSAPPNGLEVASFEKMFLGGVPDKSHMTLSHWTGKHGGHLGDWILQMDIEGAEYETLLATPSSVLRRFRIIAVELHAADQWFNPLTWGLIRTFFVKLLEDFYVVHNHPNNNCPFVQVGDDIVIPTVFELTLLRKDRSPATGFCTEFPHPLDQPNVLDKPDRPLPEGMYK